MPDVTMIVGYYEQPGMLEWQLRHMTGYAENIKRRWRLIVVDDGSPNKPACLDSDPGFPVSLYRVLEDVPWNDKGARNIGAQEARSDWLLVTDIDHAVPEETARGLVEETLDHRCHYGFERVLESTGEGFRPHQNSWFLSRELWHRIGGCDERLSGVYGGSGLWNGRASQMAGEPIRLPLKLMLVEPRLVGDAMAPLTRRYEGDIVERRRVRQLIDAAPETLTMSFPYERVQ